MSSFKKAETEHQRRVILEALEQDPAYSHNDQILKSVLGAVGHYISTDKLKTELDWLEEQGLVELSNVGDLTIARLTSRGQDVAMGVAMTAGVARKKA